MRRAAELWAPALRTRTLLVGIGWFGSTCAYYGVALGCAELGGGAFSIYAQSALSALLEVTQLDVTRHDFWT
jgi:hypothetical protein